MGRNTFGPVWRSQSLWLRSRNCDKNLLPKSHDFERERLDKQNICERLSQFYFAVIEFALDIGIIGYPHNSLLNPCCNGLNKHKEVKEMKRHLQHCAFSLGARLGSDKKVFTKALSASHHLRRKLPMR